MESPRHTFKLKLKILLARAHKRKKIFLLHSFCLTEIFLAFVFYLKV